MYHEAFTTRLGNRGVFIRTRVKCPTKDGWGGLRRFLIKATKYDKRIICSGALLKLETWIDSFHAVHEDMRRNTGGFMSCGIGIIHSKA